MVPGQTPAVVEGGSGAKGHHQAVTIMEDGIVMEGGTGGGFKKRSPGAAKLKLQLRKQSKFKVSNLSLLSDWVNSLSSGGSIVKHVPTIANSTTTQADPPDMNVLMPSVHKIGPDIKHAGREMLSSTAFVVQSPNGAH
ncbi:hypothetical protein V6N13_106905 [Hibiscus sabdariffa]|uniref:Uncharacterized protein n=1 Tax=Hibiscus sabdariffa TaxID=183260 RepID=A0ABR2F251_9ROSI